ncbi:hypothetical protein QTO34_018189 [Cnephaeus nilssonii]|uniref:Protein SDA1 n=1 Tax=Cnephaeus nilssonii TaxID=3371016 RepID=A0AA40HZ53_CNENI|nr:hypothetical protein QTO34_018189 [Eptesicus nilssonii]
MFMEQIGHCYPEYLSNFLQELKDLLSYNHTNINAKHKNNKVKVVLQNFIYTMLKDSNATTTKVSLDMIIELYRRNIWK